MGLRRPATGGPYKACSLGTVPEFGRVRLRFLTPASLGRSMVLLAKDIMDTSFLSLDEDTDAFTGAKTMVDRHKGYAVVTQGSAGHVVGIVTEWDFLSKVVAQGIDPVTMKMKDLASPTVHACAPDTPTDEVVSSMASRGIRRMVVRSGDQVVGIITARNVLARFREYVDKLSREIASYQSSQTPLG